MTSSVSGSSKSPRKPPVSYRKWMDADNPVCCKCSGVMLELTSWTDSNPSRGFLRCQKDKIYALREANNDLRDRLDESNERVVVQEAEIARLRMQLEKITSDRQTENDFSCSVCCNLVFAHALVSTWGCGRQ
ncbi:uncharacterized protein [Zea mays]|uniref:Uncharacterized protein n=1 Tax=Zea mays TaxID=4577 RepID=A0A1D6P4S7_MAIZE|nr:uncharacterized protein LOC100276090 isoform 2 [Zea mays]XP_035818080.1 uncharacterized protein LOC100276090 isoform X1 [Zea mays]AQL04954.1 hypothetical protein ZEAMMB73_Zm00001d046739 [Zea mays]|eukprot:NP_001335851.1 uncharacterized protein LOC100276090 isoform 2 [Zea mays]